ncbi:hypothetical protein HY086_06065 [Candidatus Gottesmanbacteria bacterium]|nr:hypothetical protein [Candidatus Gottesmanbacteria bacterium]
MTTDEQSQFRKVLKEELVPVTKRLDKIDIRLGNLEAGLIKVENGLSALKRRFNILERWVTGFMDKEMSNFKQRIVKLETRVFAS